MLKLANMGESRDPSFNSVMVAKWIPAFAGMTRKMPLAGVETWAYPPAMRGRRKTSLPSGIGRNQSSR